MRKIVRLFTFLCVYFDFYLRLILRYLVRPNLAHSSNVRHACKTYWNLFVLNKSYLNTPSSVYGYVKKVYLKKITIRKNKTVRGVFVGIDRFLSRVLWRHEKRGRPSPDEKLPPVRDRVPLDAFGWLSVDRR